jgi:capsular polysaccharide export protein
MHGLTFQGALDDFWSAAPTFRPDPELYRRFREYVIRHTQLNGNFYRRLEIPGMASGLVYPPPSPVSSGDQSFTTQNSTLFEPSENIS